jgi:hypothetical protein
LCFVLWISPSAAGCEDADGPQDARLLYQVSDPKISVVAKVIARDNERMLVLGNGSDLSEPCSYDWWMNHEVQGKIECEEALPNNNQKSFLQVHARADGSCPHCTPKVDASFGGGVGIYQSMLALSKLTPDGKPRHLNRALVIGLGAGVLPSWLAARTDATLDVVDIAQSVVDVAPCFGVQEGPHLSLHVADGRRFLSDAAAASYDTIVVDAFDSAASMPPHMRSVEFFQLVASRLSENGVLLLNLLKCGSDQDGAGCGTFQQSVVASVQQAFAKTYLGQAPGAVGSQALMVAEKSEEPSSAGGGLAEPSDEVRAWFKAAQIKELGQDKDASAFHDDAK